MKQCIPLTFCINLLVFIVGVTLLLHFTGPNERVFTPPAAQVLFWLTVLSGILVYSSLAYLFIAQIARALSPLHTTLAALLVAIVTVPVAFFGFWFALFAFDSIPRQVTDQNGHKIYQVGEGLDRDYPVFLVPTDSWLWLEQDASISECTVYPQSIFCSDSLNSTTQDDSATSSPSATVEPSHEQEQKVTSKVLP